MSPSNPSGNAPMDWNHNSIGNARDSNNATTNSRIPTTTPLPQMRQSDETETPRNEQQRSVAFLKAAAEGQTKRMQRRFLCRGEEEVDRLLDYSDDRGYTALHLAALNGFGDTVEALLDTGADVNPWSDKHGTPLHLAAIKGRADVVDLLLENRAVVDHPSEALGLPLHCAAFSGNISIADALTCKDARLEASANVSLSEMYAVSGIPLEDRVLDPARVYKCQPLIVAIKMQSRDIIQEFMDSIPCVDQEYELHHGHVVRGITPLMLCAGDGFVSFCEELMRKGASRTKTNSWGWNAVTYAARFGRTACIKALLLDHPGDDSRQSARHCDNQGWTPLIHAARSGRVDTVQELLKCGVDVDQPSNPGNATSAECYPQRSDKDWSMQRGVTALHLAADRGYVEIVKKLTEAGASWTTKTEKGKTPVDAARGKRDVLAFRTTKRQR